MKTSRPFHKKLLCASVASVLGLAASGAADAHTYELSFTGAFTMLSATGTPVANQNTPYNAGYNDPYSWYGARTPMTGTMTYDDGTGLGTMSINGFYFFGTQPQNIALARDTTFQTIGDGAGGAGTLMLGNMLFDWNLTVGIPVSIVWDGQGFLNALPTVTPGTVIQNSGVLAASDGLNFGTVKKPAYYPLGPVPIATTTWNTTPTCVPINLNDCLNTNPSGSLPLIADTIGSSPMIDGPFAGFNANFDFMKLTVTKVDGVSGGPVLQTKAPADGAMNVNIGTTVTLTFTNEMQADTVASAFSLSRDGGLTIVPGTLSPNTGTATNFTFTPASPLSYSTTYTATVTNAAKDIASQPLSGAPIVWSFTTAAPPVAGTACTPVATVPIGSNFTMLTGGGVPFGGTNDVTYTIDTSNLNTSVSGTNFNMTLASAAPWPFFGYTWTAHDIRVFGPGDYTFDTTCTVAQIQSGVSNCNNPLGPGQTQRYLTMHVGAGQLGAHMLFDWNVTQNIDVANVWNQNSTWNSDPLGSKNDLWTGDLWGGPSGVTLNPNTTWQYVSTDNDGNGVNGIAMVDGPFIGFSANFNLGAADSCQPGALTPINIGAPTSAPGCSISTKPSSINIFDRSDWLLIGGFLAWLGALRFRSRRTTKD